MKKDSVDMVSDEMELWLEDSHLPRTLSLGTAAMKKAGPRYLPQNKAETNEAYALRLEYSTLLNAYRKTCAFLAGQVFQVDIAFDDSVPDSIINFNPNIDDVNNSIDVVAKRLFQSGMAKGVSHIFIDSPPAPVDENGDPVALTRQQEDEQGIRPYFVSVRPEDILGGRFDMDTMQFTQIRFREIVEKNEGKYSTKVVSRVRVLFPGAWELWEDTGNDNYVLIDSGTFSVPYIPFVTFIPGMETTLLTGETPLMDLAEINLAHWRSNSDQTNILHVGRVPLLFGRNVDPGVMPVGTASMVNSSDDNSDLKFVEITGAAIGAGRDSLKDLEAQMALYGLQQLVPRTGNQTATEKALTSAESNSSLGTWATEFQSFLIQAYSVLADFMGETFPDNGLLINQEYNFGVSDPQIIQAILKSNEMGVISTQETFRELKRRGVFSDDLSWETMQADIEQEQRDNLATMQMAGSAFGGAEN